MGQELAVKSKARSRENCQIFFFEESGNVFSADMQNCLNICTLNIIKSQSWTLNLIALLILLRNFSWDTFWIFLKVKYIDIINSDHNLAQTHLINECGAVIWWGEREYVESDEDLMETQ